MDQYDDIEDELWKIYKGLSLVGEPDKDRDSPSYHFLRSSAQHYSERELIGTGALKAVYKCYDMRTQRPVALAELKPNLDASYFDAFIHEAWLTARLNHPNIIKVYDVNVEEASQRPYFTMDLRSDFTLASYVQQPLSLRSKLETFLKICDAIDYAHSQETLHLDLKPENIQCDTFGEVVVCDWGLGKRLDSTAPSDSTPFVDSEQAFNTLYGTVRGTPGYMAPEQIDGGEKSYYTDTFSLGALLYFLLTGYPPFKGESRDEIFQQTRTGAIQLHPVANKRLLSVCQQALAPEPENRYASVHELKQEIIRFLEGYTIKAERAHPVIRAFRFVQRHQRVAIVTFIAVVVMVAIALYSQAQTRSVQTLAEQYQNEAERVANESEAIHQEYEAFEQVVQDTSDNIHPRLLRAAADAMHKSQGVFHYGSENQDPIAPLERAIVLMNKCLELDATHTATFNMWVKAHFLGLNFSEILTREDITDTPMTKVMYQIAQEFEQYHFSKEHRPNSKELALIFRALEPHHEITAQHMESILRYDVACGDGKVYRIPIRAIIKRMNKDARVEFRKNSLTLRAPAPLNVDSTLSPRHYISYLDKLRLDHLIVITPESYFYLNMLDGCSFDSVDLSQVRELHFSKPLDIKKIKKLTLPIQYAEESSQVGQALLRLLNASGMHEDFVIEYR